MERLEQRQVLAFVAGTGGAGSPALAPLPSPRAYDSVNSQWFWTAPGGAADRGPAARAMVSSGPAEELLVRLKNESLAGLRTAEDIRSFLDPAGGLGLRVIAGLGLPGLVLVGGAAGSPAVAGQVRSNPGVAYVESNVSVTMGAMPNDPRFGELYGLHNVGQSGGWTDADIDAPEAWDMATGSRNTVVSVIDTGIDMTHPDLFRNIWINQTEIPSGLRAQLADVDGDRRITFVDLNHGANARLVVDGNRNGRIDAPDLLADRRWADGTDTDGNGFVDDFFGWDFVNNDNNPSDDNRHGTHCAGTIGAQGNDGIGVVGVNWQVSLMGLKFLSSGGSGSTANAVKAVNYATMMRLRGDDGIRVTSNSWGGGGYSQSLVDAIDAGGRADILFVAAAGNDGRNTDVSPNYPSGYDSAAILAVAALDRNDGLASFSNFGAASTDLGAPGVNIVSSVTGGGYASLSGTSMATPHVAGAAALALSANPRLSLSDLRHSLLSTVDPVPALAGRSVTGGRLNARRLLELVGRPAPGFNLQGGVVAENAPVGTVAGTLAVTPAASYVFALVPGVADNARFTIAGREVRTAASFDYETQRELTIRIRATGGAGESFEKSFVVRVANVNEAPTGVTLSGNRVRTKSPAGTTVGTIAAVDPDGADTFTYGLASGAGDTDNAAFEIRGATLRTAAVVDFANKRQLSVRIRATDAAGKSAERAFTISELTSDRFGFDSLVVEAFQAGSTLDLDNLQVVDLATGQVVYRNDFNTDDLAGLTLTHWCDQGVDPIFDATKTRIVDGRLRLESTGFGRNGSGGYNSRSRATLNMPLPENFEASFTIYKHQWQGHVFVQVVPAGLGVPFTLPQNLVGVGGFATNINGGQINVANVLGPQGTVNLLNPPGTGTTGPFLRTDVRYRIVKQDGTLRVYVQDQLRAETTSLVPIEPLVGRPTDILLQGGNVTENAPAGTNAGTLATVDPDADDRFVYQLVAGAGDADNAAFRIVGNTLRTTVAFDFERRSSYTVRVRTTDSRGLSFEKALIVRVTDVNEPPTGVSLRTRIGSLPENADTTRAVRLADIVIADDALGTNQVRLAGPDAAAFEVAAGALWLKAGITLDRTVKPSYAVSVLVSDPALGAPSVGADFVLTVTPAATTWSYGFRHVNEAGADRYLVESVAMRKYSEWQQPPITYWGPTTNGVEGRLVYRFDMPQNALAIRMRISLPSWDYGSCGRGAFALDVSKNGTEWTTIRNNLEPRRWGEKWGMDDLLPAAVLGGKTLFVRMRFLVENTQNTSFTNAQFGRSTSAAQSNVFEIEATLATDALSKASR